MTEHGNKLDSQSTHKQPHMNSKLLLAMFLGASATLSAQNASTQSVPANTTKKNNYVHQHAAPASNSFSNRVDIWTNDFSNAADWVLTNEVGNNSNWVIGTAVPAGNFPITAIASTSAANGYALFDSDLDCSGNQVPNLTTANSIDCSLFPAVVLEFEQQYRRFDDSTFVFVSNDGGTNWVKYTVNGTLTNNDATATNPDVAKVNITATAGGQANVKIRFQFWSPATYTTGIGGAPGCAYAWMIDDVKLVTPPDYELLVSTVYHGDPYNNFEYGTYPLSQVDTVRVVAIVSNEGGQTQQATVNYTVTRGATTVNNGSSATFDIAPFTSDTIIVSTGYVPDAVGNYSVAATITSANEDFDPSNNSGSSDFVVSDYIYSGLTGLAGTSALTFSGAGPTFDASKIAHQFIMINNASLKAIDIAVSSLSDDVDLIIELFDAADLTVALGVGDFSITSSHPTTAQYYSIIIDEQSLTAGNVYVASVGSEATDKKFVFYGVDGDPDDATLVNVPDDNGVLTWFRTDLTPAVNLNFNPSVGIADLNASPVNVSVYPNPATEQITWNVKLQNSTSVNVSLIDINGKVVFNKTVKGKLASYSDTLNVSEFANGVYTLQVKSNDVTNSQKVVIAH